MSRTRVIILTAALLLAGCRVHQVKRNPPPPLQMPLQFTGGKQGKVGKNQWWLAFGDPALNRLVQRAVSGNFQVRAAWARIAQARAMARKAAAGWQPNVQFSADYSRRHSIFYPGGKFGKFEQTANSYNLSLGASYEIDAWGRVASLKDAADLDTFAARMNLEAMAMTISAQIATTWFNLQAMEAQRRLLLQQLKVDEDYLDLVRMRYGQGMTSALDVLQQRQQTAAIRAQIPGVEASIALFRHQLSVLVGRPPQTDVAGPISTLDDLPPLPPTGVPADLLAQRPDVVAARLRIVATDHRLAAAIADWLPGFTLNASTGFNAQDITKLFASWIWNLGAGLIAKIWDGGRMLAEQKRLRAQIRELTANYGQVVLNALKEVQDALVQGKKQADYIRRLNEQLTDARATLKLAEERYRNGLADYLSVLTALQRVQQLERGVLSARAKALIFRVQLCRALGGSWTRDLKPPKQGKKQAKNEAKP